MFDGQSCEVGIRHQIGNCLTIGKYLLEDSPVSLCRPNDPCTRLIQPTLNTILRLIER